jgi:hypothetical protein
MAEEKKYEHPLPWEVITATNIYMELLKRHNIIFALSISECIQGGQSIIAAYGDPEKVQSILVTALIKLDIEK